MMLSLAVCATWLFDDDAMSAAEAALTRLHMTAAIMPMRECSGANLINRQRKWGEVVFMEDFFLLLVSVAPIPRDLGTIITKRFQEVLASLRLTRGSKLDLEISSGGVAAPNDFGVETSGNVITVIIMRIE
jgi:hypothetical protein